jgi:hypothetical protein
MVSSGLLRSVALVRTDVSEQPCASFIRVTKIGELGTTQAATSNYAAKKWYFFAAYVGYFRDRIECCGMDWSGSGYVQLESSCELGNEPSGSIKCWETTEWLHNLWPLEWNSAPHI